MKPIEDKNFLNFVGKPLIQHQLELLHESGLDEVVVVGGNHNLDRIKALGSELKMNIQVVEQEDLELGMAGAVLAAKHLLDGPVVVLSSNDIVDKSAFEMILDAAKSDDAESFILGKKVDEYFPGGYLEISSDGFIKNIVEKPAPGTEPSDMINLVVHLHKNPEKLIACLEKTESKNDDRYEMALGTMIAEGCRMRAIGYNGFWQAIKFPWHVVPVFKYFFSRAEKRISKSAEVSKNAVINNEVIIEDGVKIFDGAVINGPCYLGKGSVVATNSLVRESNIGENCVIGFSTEVARSYLGNDVWTHSNYIGDSVIENNVSFGAGAVTGNLRLDEKNVQVDYDGKKFDTKTNKFGAVIGSNVRVGVNTSLMPGVKIGGDSFIGAGIVVAENVPEKSFVRGSWELKISENKQSIDSDRKDFKKKL